LVKDLKKENLFQFLLKFEETKTYLTFFFSNMRYILE